MIVIRIAICEDDAPERELLAKYCSGYAMEAGYDLQVEVYQHTKDLPHDIAGIDLMFLDIMMDGKAIGVDTARTLRGSGWRGGIVFVTSSKDYYPEGFEVGAIHYLLKPLAYSEFVFAMERTIDMLGRPKRQVTLPISRGQVAFLQDTILYAEVSNRQTLLHLENETIRVLLPLQNLEKLLAGGVFLRCFRSYLVNMDHIARIQEEHVVLSNGECLQLALRNRQKVKDRYMDYRFAKIREKK